MEGIESGGNLDTAANLAFTITDGSGELHTAKLSQYLKDISGAWNITNAKTDQLTATGSYSRSAVDTLRTNNAVRTLDHTIAMQFTNIQGPRHNRVGLASASRGTITGTYHATATFTSGSLYQDRTVDRTFTITLLGDDSTKLEIGGRTFRVKLSTGELVE